MIFTVLRATKVAVWHGGSMLILIILVLGWVIVCRFELCARTIFVFNHPLRPTQPGHSSKGWGVNRHSACCTSPMSVVWSVSG